MAWSFRIGRIAGIDLKLHVTFALILGLGALQWGGPHGARGAAFGVLLVALLFVCVVLHELGHALMARRFGIATHAIVLLPIGGVAQLARSPDNPRHELWIAAAGPVVNLLIAGALLLATIPMGLGGLPEESLRALVTQPTPSALLLWLLGANVTMALFNLLPALPMDGGRILRAALTLRMGATRATPLAATVSQVLALGLGTLGLLQGNFLLAFIAAFVFLGAAQERVEVEARHLLSAVRAGDAWPRHAITLSPGDRLNRVVEYLLTSPQQHFAVLLGGQLQGVLNRGQVLRALQHEPPESYVAGLMERNVPRVDEGTSLEEVRRLMAERGASGVAVYRGEEFLGVVGLAEIAEALRVASALGTAPALDRRRPTGGVRPETEG
jgi:Zn-dependent protease